MKQKILPLAVLGFAFTPTVYCGLFGKEITQLPKEEQISRLESSLKDLGYAHIENRPLPFTQKPNLLTNIDFPCDYNLTIKTQYNRVETLAFNFRESIKPIVRDEKWTYENQLVPKSRFVVKGSGLTHKINNNDNNYVLLDKEIKSTYEEFHRQAQKVCSNLL